MLSIVLSAYVPSNNRSARRLAVVTSTALSVSFRSATAPPVVKVMLSPPMELAALSAVMTKAGGRSTAEASPAAKIEAAAIPPSDARRTNCRPRRVAELAVRRTEREPRVDDALIAFPQEV